MNEIGMRRVEGLQLPPIGERRSGRNAGSTPQRQEGREAAGESAKDESDSAPAQQRPKPTSEAIDVQA